MTPEQLDSQLIALVQAVCAVAAGLPTEVHPWRLHLAKVQMLRAVVCLVEARQALCVDAKELAHLSLSTARKGEG